MNKAKPELLAPAGNIASAITALDAGADAVYAGLSRFNARARTENFTEEELAKAITYAHSLGKKLYVVLNTIIKEREIAEFAKAVATVASFEADAVIIQDLGALRIVRDYFPMLGIHASTQMGIHNLSGCKLAKELGFGRVILERQTSYEELCAIVSGSPVEIEVFVHGALCCSISGACLLSSWISGESGNRGECKQTCRRKFTDSSGREGYFLSTKDLSMLDDIPKLAQAGVSSLKIEGRLKKNDYVRNTVRAYRTVLDAEHGTFHEAVKEAKDMLELAFGRRSVGIFSGPSPFSEMLNPDESGTLGLQCGKISRVAKNGFYLLCKRKIHLGDRLRIQSPDQRSTCIFTVNKILLGRTEAIECPTGRECFIPSMRRPAPASIVLKIGESIPDFAKKIARLPVRPRRPLEIHVKINSCGFAMRARWNSSVFEWNHETKLQPAEKHALSSDKIANEFSASCSEKFFASEVNVEIEGEFFVPPSALKEIRRDFWRRVSEFFSKSEIEIKAEESLSKFIADYANLANQSMSEADNEISILISRGESSIMPDAGSILVRDVFYSGGKAQEVQLPAFCPEKDISRLKAAIERAYSDGTRRFRCQSLFEVELLKPYSDIKIVSCYPFAAANSLAVCEFRRLGVSKVQAWPELDKGSFEELLKKSLLPLEIWSEGRIPLMFIRTRPNIQGFFRDDAGNEFYIEKLFQSDITAVYPKKLLKMPRVEGFSEYRVTTEKYSDSVTSSFNANR